MTVTRLGSPSAPAPAGVENLRIDLLASFACVAHELHFTRAARLLHLSQPGLTRRVAQLERCLGHTLLDRTSRQVQLTAAGRALLPIAVAILEQAALAATAVDAASRGDVTDRATVDAPSRAEPARADVG